MPFAAFLDPLNSEHSNFQIRAGKWIYEIDFENMKQVIESERKSGSAQKIENNTPCDIVSTLLHGRKDGHK